MAITKRAALYVRVSTERQEEEGTSLVSQEERAKIYCEKQGYAVQPQHIYREVHTGTVYRERPLMSALREAARNNEFDVVVVYAYDRLARKQVHQAVIIDDLEHNNITIESVTENFDDSALGQYMRSTYAFMAELEREKIIERTERGRKTRIGDGKLVGAGRPLYGYTWNEGHTAYRINPEEAAVVRRIYALAVAGYTIRGIGTTLTKEGILTRNGNTIWRNSTMHQILANPAYTGEAIAHKYQRVKPPGKKPRPQRRPEEEQVRLPEGVIPAIIDKETFEQVQQKLLHNKQLSPRHNSYTPNELLRCGLVVCGHCGGTMSVHRQVSQGFVNYVCNKGNQGFGYCRRTAIRCIILDEAAWGHALEIIKDPSLVAQKLEQRRRKNPTDGEFDPINRRDKRLNEIEQEITNLVTLAQKAPSMTVLETTGKLLAELDKEKKGLLEERKQLVDLDTEYKKEQEALALFAKKCATMRTLVADPAYMPSYEFKREAIEYFGIKAHVWRVGHTPRYTISGNPPDIVSLSLHD